MTLFFLKKTTERSAFRISRELGPLSAKHSSPTKKREQSHPYSAKHAVQRNTSGISKAALKKGDGNISRHPWMQVEFNVPSLVLSVSVDTFVI